MAVLLVVLAHAGVRFVPGGFVGVDVFFVLSGFLITGLLLAEARARGSISLLEFYLRRARRILPAAALTLVATNVAALFLLNFVRAEEAVDDGLYAAAFAANFRFAAQGVDYFAQTDPPSALLHYWSLAVEEQFYLVWPALLSVTLFGLARRRRRRGARIPHKRRLLLVVVVLTAASLGWSAYRTATLPAAAYFSPFTRAWELGLGATLALCASTLARVPPPARLALGWAGIAAIALAAVVFSDRTPFPGSAALLPTAGTALAIVAGMGDRRPRLAVARLLALRPMGIVGERSYALYLWHWPVLILADQSAGYELPVSVKLGLVAGAFLLSCVSYSLVENPIRRKVRSRTVTWIVVAVSMAAVFGTASVSLAAIDRDRQRFEARFAAAAAPVGTSYERSQILGRATGALPSVVAAVEAARRGDPIPSGLTPPIRQIKKVPSRYAVPNECIAHDSSSKVTSPICRLGRTSSSKVVVVIGDSHAFMWMPAILESARREGWAVIPLLRLGCTPHKWTTSDGGRACRNWYRWAILRTRRLRPWLTLVGGNVDERQTVTARRGIDGIIGAARAVKPLGPVVVIGDPEGLEGDPVDCLLSRDASMARCTTTWSAGVLAAYDTVARRAKEVGVRFLPTRGFVCFERQCPVVVGRTIAWMDNNHLSPVYAAQTAGAFRAALLRAIGAAQR